MAATASSSVGTVDEEALPPKERTGLAAVGGAALDLVDLRTEAQRTELHGIAAVRRSGRRRSEHGLPGHRKGLFDEVVRPETMIGPKG